jgi:hypothetical protein
VYFPDVTSELRKARDRAGFLENEERLNQILFLRPGSRSKLGNGWRDRTNEQVQGFAPKTFVPCATELVIGYGRIVRMSYLISKGVSLSLSLSLSLSRFYSIN